MSQPSRTATQWLSARQVADELGLKPETVARHLAAGKIPGGTRAFGNWRVNSDTYLAWKTSLTEPADPHMLAPRSTRSTAARRGARNRT